MNMSGMSTSIADRLYSLECQLMANKPRFFRSIIDLENKLAEHKEVRPTALHYSVTIEEFADEGGYLDDPNIPEPVWLETLSRETDLDCRMLVDWTAPRELGLFTWEVLVSDKGQPTAYEFKVWIVPVGKGGK